MRIGKDLQPYYMNEQPFDYVKEGKDLGIVVDTCVISCKTGKQGSGINQTFVHCIG